MAFRYSIVIDSLYLGCGTNLVQSIASLRLKFQKLGIYSFEGENNALLPYSMGAIINTFYLSNCGSDLVVACSRSNNFTGFNQLMQ